MSYYGEWKRFKRELEEEEAKPEPDKEKIEQLEVEIKNLKYMMNHDE